jgi:RNA-directed DNA polymerase
MCGTFMRENREVPRSPCRLIAGGAAQGTHCGTPEMHGRGKSDRPVVPAILPNKAAAAAVAAEVGEGRGRAKGNTVSKTHPGRSAGGDVSSALGRVREVARRDGKTQFTALLHHVGLGRLRRAYGEIRSQAAPGVDGVTWAGYGQDLEGNLRDLHERVQSGRYRAKPGRRAFILKADGRLRPLAIAALEDKVVQRAVVEVLNAVYEVDFRGFSYGFRPGRGPHDALDAFAVAVWRRSVNWVLDADIRDFFGQLDHVWLRKFLQHRIADQRVLRLIDKWLAAGVVEDGELTVGEEGSPQGASVSPLLANIYLHYVFDLWADWWRRTQTAGDVVIVRFADDFVVGFQREVDARRFLVALRERFAGFGLALHPDKTQLVEFGRFAARDRARRGLGKPDTLDFLGFTHICATTRSGQFWLRRVTIRKRMRGKLREVNDQLKRRRHQPVPVQGQWLRSVVQGHLDYYAVPGNTDAVAAFRYQVTRHWRRALQRRSQRTRITWERMGRLAAQWLPKIQVVHPFPEARLRART